MDNLTFVTELTKAVAWPITTIVVVVVFRTEFRSLLGRLKKGKVGSAEFEFEEGVKEVAKDIAETSPTTPPATLNPEIISLATLNPRAALLNSWVEVEAALINLAQKHELLNSKTRQNSSELIRELVKAELIPKALGPGFHALRRLRNQAAHEIDFKPSVDAVLGYLEIAEELKQLVH